MREYYQKKTMWRCLLANNVFTLLTFTLFNSNEMEMLGTEPAFTVNL